MLDIERRRRPYVHTKIWGYQQDPHIRRSSGVDVTVSRAGIAVGGWYDSIVGIESWFISWEDLLKEREALK